jgi:hypothetical protein
MLNDLSRRRMARFALQTLLCALLWSCGGGSSDAPSPSPPPDAALSISTTSLPHGQAGHAYVATLTASGGTAPLSWKLTGGTLPAGLTLAANGSVSGTPGASADATSLTFTVTDSYATAHSKSVTLPLTISPASINVTVSPARAGLTVRQTLSLSAVTNDYAGVTWSSAPAGGTFSAQASASGAAVTFTAPATAGAYTVTATSATDSTQKSSLTVGVTDLAGVLTYHNDLSRGGVNAREFALNSANVNTSTFGKLFSCSVDGAIYAQPLWIANLVIGGTRHNVVFVGTAQDSLYAFDADTSPCLQLWHVSLIDPAHGGTGSDTTGNDLGIVSTPVIDPASNILYVVTRSLNAAGTSVYQRLHGIDITTGNEKTGSPLGIAASYPDTGGQVTFDPAQHVQRAGLALAGGTAYLAFASYGETIPWFGWIMGYTYSGAQLTQVSVFNTTPNENGGGIWMGGGAPAADNNGNLYVITGNGTFDAATSSATQKDYGDSFLQLTPGLAVSSYFTPTDQNNDAMNDVDFGAGGAAIVLNLDAGSGPLLHAVVGGGKDGALYLLNGDSMGGPGDGNALQRWVPGGPIYSTGVFWNDTLYIGPGGASLQAYAFSPVSDQFNATATSLSSTTYGKFGAGLAISSSGSSGDAVVWGLDSGNFCFGTAACGPAVLHAYSAANLATELWNSSMAGTDAAGHAVKFTVPTVANGKVYVGTRGNNGGTTGNGSGTIAGELDVYGLKP